jgi:hypothetical protein
MVKTTVLRPTTRYLTGNSTDTPMSGSGAC